VNAKCRGPATVAPRSRIPVADDASATAFAPALRSLKQSTEFINAWGIAIRPAGAGGHFWVGAGGYSYQFVGDVTASPDASLRTLFQDALAIVAVPGAGGDAGFTTGVVFNGAPLASDKFVVTNQAVDVDGQRHTLSGSARFLVLRSRIEAGPVGPAVGRRRAITCRSTFRCSTGAASTTRSSRTPRAGPIPTIQAASSRARKTRSTHLSKDLAPTAGASRCSTSTAGS